MSFENPLPGIISGSGFNISSFGHCLAVEIYSTSLSDLFVYILREACRISREDPSFSYETFAEDFGSYEIIDIGKSKIRIYFPDIPYEGC